MSDLRYVNVTSHDKRGIIAGGHMHNFVDHKHEMSASEYIHKVATDEIYDATLTFQKNNGFELVGALENYLTDAATDNWSALIVWRNPDYSGIPAT